jgi:hypothetical protein
VLVLDGQPVLLMLTRSAEELSLFAEKRLRLFDLLPDRTRLGLAPRLATQSRMNLWQASHPRVLDLDTDGRDDLVLGYWKGLTEARVVLDLYTRREDGSFADPPRTTAFDVKDADRSVLEFGADVDGDGRPDLLVQARERLWLHRGTPPQTDGRIVDKKGIDLAAASGGPSEVVLEVGSEGARTWSPEAPGLFTADLDGAGGEEVVLVRAADEEGRGRIQVIQVRDTKTGTLDR